MDAWIFRELWVKRRRQMLPLLDEHGLISKPTMHGHVRADGADPRRADESAWDGPRPKGELGAEAVRLSAKGVTLDMHVDQPQGVYPCVGRLHRHEDASGAGAEEGLFCAKET